MIEILCTRSNYSIDAIKEAYKKGSFQGSRYRHFDFVTFPDLRNGQLGNYSIVLSPYYFHCLIVTCFFHVEFDRDLEKDLVSETSGNFQHLLVSECNAHRDTGRDIDVQLAKKDAQNIFEVSITLDYIRVYTIGAKKR